MSIRSWSVEQLINYLKNRLENDAYLSSLWVKGEISNFVNHSSGHFYFTLKDEKAAISCVMFSTYARRIGFTVKEGAKVLLRAKASIYEKTGRLQLYVYEMQPDGIGLLYQRFEELKAKLYQEGYFREDHKKPLPHYPFDIAVISGEHTAAHSDILTTLKRRWPVAKITDYYSLVQGETAAANIVSRIREADQNHHDVIILARGGGSLEDLWCFNEESVVKAIYHCETPIITGIGHEVDFTLSDFAADVRANTPTGAAELVAPKLTDVLSEIEQKKMRMQRSISHRNDVNRNRLSSLMEHRLPHLKDQLILKPSTTLMMTLDYLNRYPETLQMKYEGRLKQNQQKLVHRQEILLSSCKYQLERYYDKMKAEIHLSAKQYADSLQQKEKLLSAYSPLEILQRGYAIVTKEGSVVKKAEEVSAGDQLNIRVAEGEITAIAANKGE